MPTIIMEQDKKNLLNKLLNYMENNPSNPSISKSIMNILNEDNKFSLYILEEMKKIEWNKQETNNFLNSNFNFHIDKYINTSLIIRDNVGKYYKNEIDPNKSFFESKMWYDIPNSTDIFNEYFQSNFEKDHGVCISFKDFVSIASLSSEELTNMLTKTNKKYKFDELLINMNKHSKLLKRHHDNFLELFNELSEAQKIDPNWSFDLVKNKDKLAKLNDEYNFLLKNPKDFNYEFTIKFE